ncbi:MAG: hypothetical protein R3325_01400 [Thermoanaerobaculia bacterium]|nr:hypothetical protein [Thermoanaerobaculia bacterium]
MAAAALLCSLAGVEPAVARSVAAEPAWCGAGGLAEAVVEASRGEFYRARRGFAATGTGPAVTRHGEIAVIHDDGTIVRGNPFDLTETALRFKPRGRNYKIRELPVADFARPGGRRLDLADDDAVFVGFPGFRFPFYGRRYDGVWVGSDGVLAFAKPGRGIPSRDLVEFISGPPRIAGLYTDLDPALASGSGGVYLDSATGAWLRVTWYEVPLRLSTGTATFELVLHPDGAIELSLGEIGPARGIVGLSPGRTASLDLVDLSGGPVSSKRAAAVAEEFTELSVDLTAIGRAFHSRFGPLYTSLVTWLDFPIHLGFLASHRLVANEVKGIGAPELDLSGLYGSPRLESFITMGAVDRYPDDPDETFSGTFSTLDVVGHEVAHRWLAFVRFADGSDRGSRRLLGRQLGHWSFFFNSDASLMEGNEILHQGRDRFRTVDATQGYGPLDLYLMGLLAPEEVPPLFWVEGNQGPRLGLQPSSPPEIGVRFTGTRRDLVLDDIVAHEGPRRPSHTSSPKSFATAFILVVAKDDRVRPESIEKLERIRARWEPYFFAATGGRGTVTSRLLGEES